MSNNLLKQKHKSNKPMLKPNPQHKKTKPTNFTSWESFENWKEFVNHNGLGVPGDEKRTIYINGKPTTIEQAAKKLGMK